MIQKYITRKCQRFTEQGPNKFGSYIFYQIHQVAARVTKLVLGVQLGPQFGGVRSYEVTGSTIQKSNGGFL